MSAISYHLLRMGHTGRFPFNAAREYSAVFQVMVDSDDDGPLVVVAGLESLSGGLIRQGAPYQLGNDFDPECICTELVPTRPNANKLRLWHVAVKWDNQYLYDSSGKGKKPDGTPSENPLEWRDEIQIVSAPYQRPIERAYNKTALTNINRPVDTLGPVVNSSGEKFDPPPEEPQSRRIITIVQNRANYPADDAADYDQAINSDSVTITKSYLGYSETFAPKTLFLAQVGSQSLLHNAIAYWKLTWELHFDSETWDEFYLDRGTPTAKVGGAKPGGGTFAAADFPAGVTKRLYRDRDFSGEPLGPQLLDGNGNVLPFGQEPVFLQYESKRRKLRPFTSLGL